MRFCLEPIMIKSIAYAATSKTSALAPFRIERRELTAFDVQIDILYCGVCHSDLHQVKSDRGATPEHAQHDH